MQVRGPLLGLALFVSVLALGAWPWPAVRAGFSHGLSAAANPLLAPLPFDGGILVQLSPLPADAVRRAHDNVDADAQIVLSVPGTQSGGRLGLSLRRDAYLPLLIFVALILALQLRPRQLARCLALGVPVIIGVAIGSIAALVAYLLSQGPGTSLPSWQRQVLEFVFERWLTPPGNRVIAPVLLALALAALVARDSFQSMFRPPIPLGTGPRWFAAFRR